MNGLGLHWSEANAYALAGWGVRRAEWETGDGDTDVSLRWVILHNHLYYLLYLDGTTTTYRVIENADFTTGEFLATDWTVHPPDCYIQTANAIEPQTAYPVDQEVKPRGHNPLNPNTVFGICGEDPPIDISINEWDLPGQRDKPFLPSVEPALSNVFNQNPPLPGPPPGNAPQGGGAGAGDDGGAGAGGKRGGGAKPKKQKPAAPAATLSSVIKLETCSWWFDPATGRAIENVAGNVSLAATDDPRLQGNWWLTITVWASGKKATPWKTQISEGSLEAWGPIECEPVACSDDSIVVHAEIHHPFARVSSRDLVRLDALEMCSSESCPIPAP